MALGGPGTTRPWSRLTRPLGRGGGGRGVPAEWRHVMSITLEVRALDRMERIGCNMLVSDPRSVADSTWTVSWTPARDAALYSLNGGDSEV